MLTFLTHRATGLWPARVQEWLRTAIKASQVPFVQAEAGAFPTKLMDSLQTSIGGVARNTNKHFIHVQRSLTQPANPMSLAVY